MRSFGNLMIYTFGITLGRENLCSLSLSRSKNAGRNYPPLTFATILPITSLGIVNHFFPLYLQTVRCVFRHRSSYGSDPNSQWNVFHNHADISNFAGEWHVSAFG